MKSKARQNKGTIISITNLKNKGYKPQNAEDCDTLFKS